MVIAIIQARMGSSRLPGKVLMNVEGTSMIKFMYDRVKQSKLVDKIILATTINEIDNPVFDLCKKENILCYRGSENDVLDRYYKAALPYNPQIIVRLTADCPLIDPKLIDKTINLFIEKKVDYASNTVPPDIKKFPDGSDVEVFSFKNLEKSWINSIDPKEREHVTFYLWKSNNSFKTALLDNKYNWGKYRITIDYEEDFLLFKELIKRLKEKNKFGYIEEIIEILEDEPDLFKINSMYTYGLNW
jgi:spore coat polysaccharide biosynthesis protein SpsF